MKGRIQVKPLRIAGALALALVTSACGGRANNDTSGVASTSSPVVTIPLPSPSPSQDPFAGFNPTVKEDFSITGVTPTTSNGVKTYEHHFKVETDNLLRIKVSAGTASQIQITTPGIFYGLPSNYNAKYNCLKVSVNALGLTKTTKWLTVDGAAAPCFNGKTQVTSVAEDLLEFSKNATAGRSSEVEIVVKNAYYDYYCNDAFYYSYFYYYLGWSYQTWTANYCSSFGNTVYQNHTVNGMLDVQVNGSSY